MATARRRDTGLTPAQEAFAVFLSLGHTQIDAYKMAYPNQARGSKSITIAPNASRLAEDSNVVARVRQLTDALAIELGMDDKRMLAEYATILNADIRDYLRWDDDGVHLTPSSELTDEQAKAVASVKEVLHEGGRMTIDLSLHSRTKALTELAERLWPAPKQAPTNTLNVYGDVYVTQVTQQLSLLMAEADARWPGLLDWYRERVKALGEGQGAVQ